MFEFFKKKAVPKSHVRQITAGNRIIGAFTALENFTCPDTESVYVKNMQYNIREGNKHIQDVIHTWIASGKVRIG
jgi:hypothetical protein